MSNPGGKPTTLSVLGLSGSLRAASSNTAVLAAAQALAPPGMTIAICDDLGGLPFFNPDLEGDRLPVSVAAFRQKIGTADGLLISSPEYAHGISGLLKNALDWLVPSLEFPNKPVAVVNIDHLRYGTNTVCRIQVAVAVYRMFGAPAGFGKCLFAKFHTTAIGLLTIVEFYFS